jgi:hypothetical protein
MNSRSHSYEVDGYEIEGNTIRFALARPNGSGDATGSVEVVFRDVEGYLFERKGRTDAILAVEERKLDDFLVENEAFFSCEARWGWPRFWQGCAEQTAGWLAYRGRHVWNVSMSYGLSGWVVAGTAAYENAPQRTLAMPASLAAWRIPSPVWRR